MAQAALTLDRIGLATLDVLRSRWIQGAVVALVAFAVYFASSDRTTEYDQYVRLADSMLNGRLDIKNAPNHLELARYDDNGNAVCTVGRRRLARCDDLRNADSLNELPRVLGSDVRFNVINPPAPAIVLMPFVAIWGISTNEVIISLAVGAAAMGLFWIATRQLGWDIRFSAALTVLLALGTNFWWASVDGSMWTFAHVCAVFFMMGALVEATGNKRAWLVGLLVGAAGLSRLPVFLSAPFFAYLLIHGDDRQWTRILRDKAVLLRVGLFLAFLGAMFALDLAYNYERYGTLRDKGYYHAQYEVLPILSQGMQDDSYIPRHIQAIFFEPPVLDESAFPFFKPNVAGLSLFLTTPAFLYIFNTRFNRLTVAAIVGTALTLLPIVTYGVVGASQFGYRYSLDVLPMLAMLTASGMRYQMSGLKWSVVGLSCVIGLWGTLSFEKFDWVAIIP